MHSGRWGSGVGSFRWHKANDAANESRKRCRIRIHSLYTQKPLKRFDSIVLFVISNNNNNKNNSNSNSNCNNNRDNSSAKKSTGQHRNVATSSLPSGSSPHPHLPPLNSHLPPLNSQLSAHPLLAQPF